MSYIQSFKELLANPNGVINMYLAAGDAQPAVQLTSSGLSLGAGGSTAAMWRIGFDGSSLGFYISGSEAIAFTIGSSIILNNAILMGGTFEEINGITAVQTGVPAEYQSTGTSPVNIPSGGVTVATYTPVSNGLFLVVMSAMCTTTATITFAITYKDGTSTSTATQTPASGVALTANNAASFTALCNAVAGTAITVTGTASIGTTDLHGSVAIFAL